MTCINTVHVFFDQTLDTSHTAMSPCWPNKRLKLDNLQLWAYSLRYAQGNNHHRKSCNVVVLEVCNYSTKVHGMVRNMHRTGMGLAYSSPTFYTVTGDANLTQ